MTTPQDPDTPRPEPEQPTARLEHPTAQPAVEQPDADQPTVEQPGPDQHGTEPPPVEPQHTAAFAAPAPVVTRSRWRRAGAGVGRVARHRATLLVAVLLLGAVLGAGTMALVQHGNRDSRPAVGDARERVGPGGPGGRFERRDDRRVGPGERGDDRRGGDQRGGDRGRGDDRPGPGHG
ncbi:hypothetical protein JOD54_006147 [Actinokineospora baliensis]|uniref:hypothetical protein n=1 Tax=Actinokineospora baliensis TaxID=547056 RepID=UPI001EF79623|nr:hypothetical protein [Actinokineospora baliensis]MBM7775943.1 hypothetical protein [Actinokineospora baliensis]